MQADIITKIRTSFVDPDEVMSLLEAMESREGSPVSDRVYRSIVFLADGDTNKIRYYIKLYFEDYRDLLWYAEYEKDNPEVRKYDFNQPFTKLGLL